MRLLGVSGGRVVCACRGRFSVAGMGYDAGNLSLRDMMCRSRPFGVVGLSVAMQYVLVLYMQDAIDGQYMYRRTEKAAPQTRI